MAGRDDRGSAGGSRWVAAPGRVPGGPRPGLRLDLCRGLGWVPAWISAGVSGWISARVSGRISAWISAGVSGWTSAWISV
ncbi:hypothetical protein GCM10018785_29460 [Streptomyces longispororuber]|uniref:Uncharacterized protein n=1 Tax=Streptomyces longispororuber TaxID=68230 RepID=A0A918ZKR9_9ACTN|nr:hypothetical protein GCM10018785_29460 [Streptomyces longispororuber]